MKDKILKEALDWYDSQEEKPDVLIEDFIDVVIDKTAEALLDKIKDGLKEEFDKGNLKHPFVISNEYYLYLKLKDIKHEVLKEWKKRSEETQKDKKEV
jgi:hypothetical protein